MRTSVVFVLGVVAGFVLVYGVAFVQNILFRLDRIEAFLNAVANQ